MKKCIILFLVVICSQCLFAQRHSSYVISYPISFATSDLKDYIGKTSFRGLSMEFNKEIKKDVELGLEVAWHVFYEKVEDKVYTQETASISGKQYRYTNAVPILLSGKYFKTNPNSIVRPYVGLGAGTIYVERNTEFGLYAIITDTWQFCLRPELGVELKTRSGMAVLIGGKYYAGFGNSTLDAQSYISINIGFVFSGAL